MKKYKVTLSKRLFATVELEANNADEAQEEALYWLMRGIIELDGGYAHDDVDATVEEVTKPSDIISIYWDDLAEHKQEEILAAFGDNCNYDAFPIVEIPTADENAERNEVNADENI